MGGATKSRARPGADPDPQASFGALLRRHRLSAGLSQEALAERAGLSVRGLSDLERGARRTPYPDTLRRLSDALGLGDQERQSLLAVARADASPTPDPVSPAPRMVIPLPTTSFVARGRELADVSVLLRRPDVRLVTLTGPGGTGKTRLALEVASRLGGGFANGAIFVDLAPLGDAAQVVPRIAEHVNARERPGQPMADLLAQHLAGQDLLLVLDNFEHVLDAAPAVAALLAACANLAVLATSREPLRLRAEHVFPVSPLPLPEQGDVPLEELQSVASVMLFVQRARAADPAFDLSEANRAAVARICHRLEGLPLAIELAAARVRLLPAEALAVRLDRRLPLLTAGARDLPDRQRTLRDTIAWSYGLLSEQERRLFRSLTAFEGGWTLEAAVAVADVPGEWAALAALESLVDKSLVNRLQTGEPVPRFGMYETVREFGAEQLAHDPAEEAAIRQRHADFFAALTVAARRDLGAGATDAVARIGTERDNIRAALGWVLGRGDAETALAMTTSLSEFWAFTGGQFSEGHKWLERALKLGADAPPAARAYALYGVSLLALYQGDRATARTAAVEAVALAREGDDPAALVGALYMLGSINSVEGAGNAALELAEEALALAKGLDDPEWLAWAHLLIGMARYGSGDVAAATLWLEKALMLSRQLNDQWCELDASVFLALILSDEGEVQRAASLHADSLSFRSNAGVLTGIQWGLVGLAELALRDGRLEASAMMLGAAQSQSELAGSTGPFLDLTHRVERTETELRYRLGDRAFDLALAHGWSLATADAVALGLGFARDLEESAD